MSQSYKILSEIKVNQSTGKTKHFAHGQDIEKAITSLKIVQYPNDPGCYLLYFNKDGKELTDTYHENLEEAKTQAQYEFNVKLDEWSATKQIQPGVK